MKRENEKAPAPGPFASFFAAPPKAATPCPAEGVVSWNINTSCNYRCDYCTQRFKEDRDRLSRDTPRFLEAFSRLPGPWEVKLSGGEPFLHPDLEGIAAGLAKIGHRVSIVTNFSATREKLEGFVAAAGGRVGVFSCSLHLPYVDGEEALEAFFQKAAWLQALLEAAHAGGDLPRPRVSVTSVATRGALPRLADLARLSKAMGIPFKVQPEKEDREVIHYTAEEEEVILSLGGHNFTGRIVHRFEGQPCWAGSRYFILDDEGKAYRCYPARRYRLESMNSFLSTDFRLADGPSPCLYPTCNCTVPIARGMMPVPGQGNSPIDSEEDLS